MAAIGEFVDGDIAELKVFVMTTTGQLGVNILHFQIGTPTGGFNQAHMAAWGSTQFGPGYKLIIPSVATFWGCSCKNVSQSPIPTASTDNSTKGPGTDGAILLPTQTSGLISLRTPYAGRKYRGRMYIPFPSMTDNTAPDVPSASYVSAIQALGNVLAAPITITGVPYQATAKCGIFHRPPKGQPVTPSSITVITKAIAASIWATQRRRGEFGRKNVAPF